jgi:steroid delta-isomerase-like uncharacterized protein
VTRNATRDELKAIAALWMEEVWRKGHLEAIDELHAPGFVDRSPAGRPPDREGFKTGVAGLYAAFPDFHAVTERFVMDAPAGTVAIRWTGVGTHQGVFMGVPPTGKRVTFEGIEILRIENGRILERWGEWDGISLQQQLGALS